MILSYNIVQGKKMSFKFRIRFAKEDDISVMSEIERSNLYYHYYPNSQYSIQNVSQIEKILEARLSSEDDVSGLYVIEKNDNIVAFFYLFFAFHRNAFTYMHLSVKEELISKLEEVYKCALDYCFKELDYNKVNIYVIDNDNYPINRLNQCSFKKEAILREHYFKDGIYCDVIQYGVLRNEYLNSVMPDNCEQINSLNSKIDEVKLNVEPTRCLLKGKMVDLTLVTEEDALSMYEQNLHSDEKNYASLAAAAPSNLQNFIEKVNHENDYCFLNDSISFCIKNKEGKAIGTIDADTIDKRNRNLMVGISIYDSKNRRRGYGSEALKLLLDFAFLELNMHRVYLGCFAFNQKTYSIYERIGFKKEGTNRCFIYRNGSYYDEIVMGILKNEWLKKRGYE
jgi:RimJ/RimL family protein N-acetyltransferase